MDGVLIIVFIGLLVGFLMIIFIFLYTSKRNKAEMLAQIKQLQENQRKLEQDEVLMQRKLDFRSQEEKWAKEFTKIRQQQEQKMQADLAEKRRVEEEKIKMEFQQKRQKEEQKTPLDKRVLEPNQVSNTRPVSNGPIPAPVNGQFQRTLVSQYEKHILGLMMDVPTAKKREAWERISLQITNLHATSAEAAIKFLRTMSKDENASARAGMVAALAQIRSPETLDILFELRNDSQPEVQREVLKHLKIILSDENNGLPDSYREKMSQIYQGEKEKGEWII